MKEIVTVFNKCWTFQVLTAASMKMAVFWDVALCSLVKVTDVSEVLSASIIRAMNYIKHNFCLNGSEPRGKCLNNLTGNTADR
jgi:hypothetical protein